MGHSGYPDAWVLALPGDASLAHSRPRSASASPAVVGAVTVATAAVTVAAMVVATVAAAPSSR